MEYSIGEVSALLNVSRDMIRYYEKQGAIRASRNSGNNYRSYDAMEVFWLLEALQHKSWGIPINDISDIRNQEYTYNTGQFLKEEAGRLDEEASFKNLLAGRLRELEEYMLLGMKNIGNFWIEHTETEYRCHLVTGRGDEYERINLPQETSQYVFSERHIPFFDNGLTAEKETVDWEMSIRKHYADVLGGILPESFFEVPGTLCLCTHVDIGEIGAFNPNQFRVLGDYASSHGYTILPGARLRGRLLGRGFEGGQFHRIVKLYLPVC